MTLSHRRISPKELRSLGWTPGRKSSEYGRSLDYTHEGGWTIQHCGHPTALWPYILTDPTGRMILTGAAFGNPPNFGTAWPTVASAVDYVASKGGSLTMSCAFSDPRDMKAPSEAARKRAARSLAAARWEKTTPEERSEFMAGIAAQRTPEQMGAAMRDPVKSRCPCGIMTLARAKARRHKCEAPEPVKTKAKGRTK